LGDEKGIPQDLKTAAVKVARRLQSLPDGCAYTFMLYKSPREWVLIILDGSSMVERINDRRLDKND
jgi:hypothetical protein